ncbi:NrsF family protein [Bradyrhizobium sp. ORS 86]|uniref:NrsF family protein n=1 Tax=Bradyrhizobium sp. ORS 86 TaxID=1685970 RepID=UPI00388FD579
MIKTSDLIASLAANAAPVRRLRPPVMRAACWLVLAVTVLALLAVNQGIRPDLVQKLHQPAFAVCLAASALTGVLGAVAAFLVSLPDRSRLWLLLPLPALVLWLSNIGYQCLAEWVSIGPDGMSLGETARCFATLVLTSLPLSLAMLVMLRYAAPLRPTAATMMGSLAVAAITATALSLFHVIDASVMVLMWNLGTAIVFVGLSGAFGRSIFRWVAPRTLYPRD